MDKEALYEKVEKALNQAFEMTKQAVKLVSEKAGEAANLTKLHIEKATLEHKISKKFAELGSRVYGKAKEEAKQISLTDAEIKDAIEEIKKLEDALKLVESAFNADRDIKK